VALKVCALPTCPKLAPQGSYCPEHTPKPWAGSTRRRRLPPDWGRRRQRILGRDPICAICRRAWATEVDHIVNGDNHDDTNLQGLCAQCHKRKTQAEAEAARARASRP